MTTTPPPSERWAYFRFAIVGSLLTSPPVHGALHAQGWDHETSEQDAQEMETYETAILQGLGFADPYAT